MPSTQMYKAELLALAETHGAEAVIKAAEIVAYGSDEELDDAA